MISRLGGIATAVFLAVCTPVAWAGPSDVDGTFGTGGVSLIPGGDRFDAQNAPMLQDDVRIIAAGMLRNSSDRVFLARVNGAGALDTSFAGDGDLHTGIVGAPTRHVATALLPDDRVVVVGGSENSKGRISIERYTANGVPDMTLGAGTGKFTVDIGGTYARPQQAVALADGSTLVAVASNKDNKVNMTIVKLSNTGLATTFGTLGVARVAFGTKPSTAYDLAVLPNGSILVAGVAGDPATTAANLAVTRLTAAGALDKTFGASGLVQPDASGNNTADRAVTLLADATGSFAVAGPTGTGGFVARFTSTGAADGAFGTVGIFRGGIAPAGSSFTPADLALDGSGRMLLAGSTKGGGSLPTTNWTVARLNRTGAAPLDTSWGSGGKTLLSVCANTGGHGPTGLATTSGGKIYVLGNCNAAGNVGLVRLFGVDAFSAGASFSVSPLRESAGHERVPIANIDPTSVLGAVENYVSAPLGSGPLGSGPLGSGPLGSGPLGSGPLGSGPLGSGPLGSGPLGSGEIDKQILLSDLPLLSQSWTDLLSGAYGGDVPPLQTITLFDAFQKAPTVVNSLTYGDVDLSKTPLSRASLAAAVLTRPLSSLPAPSGGWCAFLSSKPFNCSNGVDVTTTTLFELEYRGDSLSAYYDVPLMLASAPLGSGPLGSGTTRALLSYVPIKLIDLADTPFGPVPASQVASLLKCNPNCTGTMASQQAADPENFSSATLGDLIGKLPLPSLSNVSLGQILTGMVNETNIPYERASSSALKAAAEFRTDHLVTYQVGFDVDCAQGAGLEVVPQLADDARPVPGSATVAVNGGAASAAGDPNSAGAYDLASVCANRNTPTHVDFTFKVEPGSVLGPKIASVLVRSAFGQFTSTAQPTVDDSLDPGDEPDQTRELTTAKMEHGWISHSRDVDFYRFTAGPAGTKTSITLTNLPPGKDYDLHVYGPVNDIESGPLHSGPLHSGPLGSGFLPDSTNDDINTAIAEPDSVQDLPLGSGPLGSGPLGSGSINRGDDDEAVTFRVRRADAGKTITVRVSGFGGVSDSRSYLLRRLDTKPPAAPPCPARTGMANGLPGTWPSSYPSDTETIYLVNRQRLAALNGSTAATDVMQKLGALAAETKGLVLPVESHPVIPDVNLALEYVGFDGSPCNADEANDVGDEINLIVGYVRDKADGLKHLRSIVIVGPDAVIPQFRRRDDTVLSNEDEYADEAKFRNVDDAVSGALRDGYFLTDDPFGDFNAAKVMAVPDVALGRLVETGPEISAQIQHFLDTDGVVSPQDASVMGYDFFTDGAQAEATALNTPLVTTWNATAAMDAFNRATSGFRAINGHYDHSRGLPEDAFTNGTPNVFYAKNLDTTRGAGNIGFTMGCHSGLNISVVVDNPNADEQERLGDWAQRMAQSKSLWIGSTTFSYGDTEAVAYTERLLADTAVGFGGRQVTVGQAMMYAKQRGLATVGVLDAYYVKSSQALTFYGLPMYRIGTGGGSGASGMPPLSDPGGQTLTSTPLSFDFSGSHLQSHTTDRGVYWTADGEDPLIVQGHPVTPLATKDVTHSDGPAKGYLIESLTTEEMAPANPVIARPTVDLEAHEPEPRVTSPLFPASLASITREATASGLRDRLTVAAGQFRGDHQRLFRSVAGRVTRSPSNDETPVVIRRVDGAVTGSAFSVRVEVDGGDAIGGNVLYRTNAQPGPVTVWHRADLAVVGSGVLATGGTLPSGTEIAEAIVQVVDDANNVSLSDYKVTGYSFKNISSAGFPKIVLIPEPSGTPYVTTSPQIKLEPAPGSTAIYEYSIDGGEWQPYTVGTTFQVPEPADGEHVITFRGSDGSFVVRQVSIDTIGPTVTAEADRLPNAAGWYKDDVTVTFRCADAVSGVASCPAPVTLSTSGANQSVTRTATDAAGHTGSGGLSGINIDKVAPTVTGAADRPPNGNLAANGTGWYRLPVTVSFACSDALSGPATCPASVNVDKEGYDQTVTRTGTDVAGNTGSGGLSKINVDLTNPIISGEVVYPGSDPNAWYASATAHFTCSDALSGILSCSGDSAFTGEQQTIAGTATDKAGNSATETAGPPTQLDLGKPTVAIDPPDVPVVPVNFRLSGTAADSRSGVDNVEVSFDEALPPNRHVVRTATLSCDALKRNCTWSSEVAPPGVWDVTATATDRAGHQAQSETVRITVQG